MASENRKPTDTRTNGDCVYSELLYQLLNELYLITLYKSNCTEAELQDIRNRINAATLQELDLAHQLWPVNKNFLRVYVKDGEDNRFTTFVSDGLINKEGDGHSARGKDDQVDKEGNALAAARDEDVQADIEGNGLTAHVQADIEGNGLTAHVQVDKEGDGLTAHVQVDKEGNGHTAHVQVDKEGNGHKDHVQVDKEGDGLTARDEDVQVVKEGNGLTAHVQVDKEGDGLTARDEDVQVDKEGDGLTACDEDVQVDKEGDGLTARDEDVQADKEGDGRDKYVQANKEGNCLTARVQADKEVDGLTARDEDIQVDKEGNGRDEDDQVDIEATNCYQSADNGSTQINGFIPSGRSYMESVKVIMTASTIPPSFVSTISPTDDMESTYFTESKKPPAQQNVPEPVKKPVPTPESSFQCGSSKQTNWRRLLSVILCVVTGLIVVGPLILIIHKYTMFSSQARTNSTHTCELLRFDSFLSGNFSTHSPVLIFHSFLSDKFFTNSTHTPVLIFYSFLSDNFSTYTPVLIFDSFSGKFFTNSTHTRELIFHSFLNGDFSREPFRFKLSGNLFTNSTHTRELVFDSFTSGNFFKRCWYTNSTHSYNVCFLDSDTEMLPLRVQSYTQETCPVESPDELTCKADTLAHHIHQAHVCSALNATQPYFLHSEPKHTEMLPLCVQSYAQETCPVESPDELTCKADDHTLAHHLHRAHVCSALNATQPYFLHSEPKHTEMLPLRVQSDAQETCPVESPDELTCKADTLAHHIHQAHVCSALNATQPYFLHSEPKHTEMLPLCVQSYAQETCPVESPDELTCRADGHTLAHHIHQAHVCSALNATQPYFLHSEPKHTEMLPLRVQSYAQETCPVESPDELTCKADDHTLAHHIHQVHVCSALDATQLINTFRRLTADGINSVLQTSLIIATSVSSMFLQASEVPYFGYWSSKDATTSTAQLGHILSLPPLKRKRKRSSSVNGKSAGKNNSEKCVCMGGERKVRMCFYATIIIIENSKRRTADSKRLTEKRLTENFKRFTKRLTENLKILCNGLFSVVCQPSVPIVIIFFMCCISRSYADQGPHKELDETCSSLFNTFLVLVHLTLVVVTLIIVLVVWKLHATNSKPSPIQRHGCTGAANAMSKNMDDFSQPLGKDSSPSKPQHKTVCAESAGHEHKLSSEDSVSLFEDSSGCSVEEHHSTSPMIAIETEPPDSQLNLNTIFFEHGDDPPDPPQNSGEDLSGSTPKPIEGHFSDYQSTYQFTPPLNRKYTGGIVTLSSGDQSIDPTVTTPIPNLQRVNNAGPYDIAHRDSQVTMTSNDSKPSLLDSEPEQRKSDTFLKPASPIPEVDMKLHDEDTTEPVLPSREQSGEDVVGGSDCVNANKQAFFKSNVQENSHAARIDEHPPDSAFVPNNGRPASNYNRLTTSEPPPGGTTSKQHVEPLDPSLTRKEVSLEGRGAQAETSGHTPPAKPPDGPDHSVKSSVNNYCGTLQTNVLCDTGQQSGHPPLQYVPGVGLAEAQTTVTNGLPHQQTLNNTVCVASPGTNLDLEGLNEVAPTDTTPTSQQIVQSSSSSLEICSQAVMPLISHSPQPNILPTDNLADDRPLSQNNPQQATNNSPSVTIVPPPCAIIRILTALIHNCSSLLYLPAHAIHPPIPIKETDIANPTKLLVRRQSYSCPQMLYRRERVVDGVSSNCVAVPSGGASVRKPLVCEETNQSHGPLIVAVSNSELELCNILHGSGANVEAHFSNNVHTHGHTIVVVSHNVGGDLSSFNTLTEQQVGVVELAPPPSAEVEGNEHPPPEDRNVIMAEYNDNTIFHGLRPRYSRTHRDRTLH